MLLCIDHFAKGQRNLSSASPVRRYSSPISDTQRWAHFPFRSGDVVVHTPPKSGTTWVITIVLMVIFRRAAVDSTVVRPWFEATFRDLDETIAALEEQQHRRCLKSHAPYDGLPHRGGISYISIFRHPLDTFLSFRNFVPNFRPIADGHPYRGTFDDAFDLFLSRPFDREDCFDVTLRQIVYHYRSVSEGKLPRNVLRLHYADLKHDLAGGVRRIARHLGADLDDELVAQITSASSFESMKSKADLYAPGRIKGVVPGTAEFFDSGALDKWRAHFSEEQIARYSDEIDALLDRDQRHWLERGDDALRSPGS